jgi:hypothetical protein
MKVTDRDILRAQKAVKQVSADLEHWQAHRHRVAPSPPKPQPVAAPPRPQKRNLSLFQFLVLVLLFFIMAAIWGPLIIVATQTGFMQWVFG